MVAGLVQKEVVERPKTTVDVWQAGSHWTRNYDWMVESETKQNIALAMI